MYSGGSRICKKKGWAEKSMRVAHSCVREARALYGWGPGPAVGPWRGAGAKPLPGAQRAEPSEALEFSANKGLQDGRQE